MTALANGVATSLDLSPRYLEWGKENFHLNQLDPDDHFFCKGDVIKWLWRFAKQGRFFHGVILDPPTFSRNGKRVFKAERDYGELVYLAARILEPKGWLLCSTNHHRLAPSNFESMLREGVDMASRKLSDLQSSGMPPRV